MSYNKNTFKIPNRLITDDTLSYSARRLGAVLFAFRNALGFTTKSLDKLAQLSDCSMSTVRKAADELLSAGYIQIRNNYVFSVKHRRMVFSKKTYAVNLSFSGGFTMMPRDIFKTQNLTHSAFCVYMFIAFCAGNKKRAFPSANFIADGLGMSEASVHRAIAVLKAFKGLLVNHCIKRNRSFSNNIYYIVTILTPPVTAPTSSKEDVPVISSHRSIRSKAKAAIVGSLLSLYKHCSIKMHRFQSLFAL